VVSITGTNLSNPRFVGFGPADAHRIDCAGAGACTVSPDGSTLTVTSPAHESGTVNVQVNTERGWSDIVSGGIGRDDDFTYRAEAPADSSGENDQPVGAPIDGTQTPFDGTGAGTGGEFTETPGGFGVDGGGGFFPGFSGPAGATGALAVGGLSSTPAPPLSPGAPPPPAGAEPQGYVPPNSPPGAPVGAAHPGSTPVPRASSRWLMVGLAADDPAAMATVAGSCAALLMFCYQIARRRPPDASLAPAPASSQVGRPAPQRAY
jgi:hypothetical protein